MNRNVITDLDLSVLGIPLFFSEEIWMQIKSKTCHKF